METPTTSSARAWHRSLPAYAQDEVDASLLLEVDKLPERTRRRVLVGWSRAASAGLYDPSILRTIADVVTAEAPRPLLLTA
jgi:hypothetical protein